MATEKAMDKKSMMRGMFRRSSTSEQGEKDLIVEVEEMPTILRRVGQKVNEKAMMDFINKEIDKEHTGHLDFEKFNKVCEKFLTDPAAFDRLKGDDFGYKHLIKNEDFFNP